MPEIISALNRRRRENRISPDDYRKIKRYLMEDVRDADIVHLTPPVVATAVSLLETSPLRAMDALHIACALEWRADVFVSSDRRQIAAAEKAGLCTRPV